MTKRRGLVLIPCLYAVLTVGACGGPPELSNQPPEQMASGGGGRGGQAGSSMGGRSSIDLPGAGDGGQEQVGGASGIGCGLVTCRLGQRCETDGDASECVDNTCRDLGCTELEECQPAPQSGFLCRSIRCDSDVECSAERHCDGQKCVEDVCEPELRECNGDELVTCASNGSEPLTPYTCQSAAYFESSCDDSEPGTIGCTCEDDWDCPEFTACEVAFCQGTGVEPTCTIAPEPFENVLPGLEFRWGGENEANPQAVGKAFPGSSQVTTTPIILNLDDDNGDGFVNELDFPEIVFMSYVDDPANRGLVRAVHGGGPNKGEDYFALCGQDHWLEGQPLKTACNAAIGDMGRPAGGIAAGDLDGDGLPEIVFPLESGALRILNHRGEIVTTSAAGLWPNGTEDQWRYPQPAIANLDFKGLPEIVVGNRVLTLAVTAGALRIDRVFTGALNAGTMLHSGGRHGHHGPTSCVADLTPSHQGLEIVAGTTAYRMPDAQVCTGNPNTDYCRNRLTVVWDATAVNPGDIFNLSAAPFYKEGFCAVADVLGAIAGQAPGPANPLDGVAEVLVLADGELLILEAATGKRLDRRALGGGRAGGAPNVDDFDGDGFPEIATALENFYTVVDLQAPSAPNCPAWNQLLGPVEPSPGGNPARNPGGACTRNADCNAGAVCNVRAGACVCLHNSWQRDTEDDSSRVSSSSIFDFNGDGAAEVIYNDECYFRIYDGATGKPHLAIPSLSRTILENPVVADVDNDGNSEIIFVNNNEELRCSETLLDSWPGGVNDVPRASLPNGIEVWGDPSDQWVAARRIWNQHSYHVTNVTEGGSIPLHEPESWKPLNGRLYNTYRAQPRNYGVAPNLSLLGVQVSSPEAGCGELTDEIQISVLIKNEGDLRVGPGVVIEFSGVFQNPDEEGPLLDANDDPIQVTLDKSLEPGATTRITVTYLAGNGGRPDLPVEVSVVIDPDNRERECNEDDNEATGTVEPGEGLADLRAVIEGANCSEVSSVVIHNDGMLPASEILVRVYAGDPSQGGRVLGQRTLAGPIEPGGSETLRIPFNTLDRNVTLYVVADPLNTILECNDANNVDQLDLKCNVITR